MKPAICWAHELELKGTHVPNIHHSTDQNGRNLDIHQQMSQKIHAQ